MLNFIFVTVGAMSALLLYIFGALVLIEKISNRNAYILVLLYVFGIIGGHVLGYSLADTSTKAYFKMKGERNATSR